MILQLAPVHRERLRNGRIGIAGAGGLGSNCALLLARAGVGALTVLDMDAVERANLDRQAYTVDQVGRRKVEALRENLAAAAPGCRVVTHHRRYEPGDARALFGDCPVVVEAFDAAATKAAFIEDVLENLPHAHVVAGSGLAGVGGSHRLRVRRLGALTVVGDGESASVPGRTFLGPRVVAVAAMQANEALHLLLTESPIP